MRVVGLACAVNGRSGDEGVRPGTGDFGDVVDLDAAVDFQANLASAALCVGVDALPRLTQLADEEATQQPDIQSLPARQSITAAPAPQAPAIPVVGPLSAAANVAVQTGAAAPVQSITQPPAQAIAQQAQPVAAQTAAAEVTDDMRLDGKRAAYAANAATGAPDDVTSSVVMKWQRKTILYS